jgi:hypothetical protein
MQNLRNFYTQTSLPMIINLEQNPRKAKKKRVQPWPLESGRDTSDKWASVLYGPTSHSLRQQSKISPGPLQLAAPLTPKLLAERFQSRSVAFFKSLLPFASHLRFLRPNLGFPVIRSKSSSSSSAAFGDNVGQRRAREGCRRCCRMRGRGGDGGSGRRLRRGAAVLRRDLLRHHGPQGGGRPAGQPGVADTAAAARWSGHPLRRLGLQ